MAATFRAGELARRMSQAIRSCRRASRVHALPPAWEQRELSYHCCCWSIACSWFTLWRLSDPLRLQPAKGSVLPVYYSSCIEVPSARKLFPPPGLAKAPSSESRTNSVSCRAEGHAIGKLTAGIVSGCCRYRPRYRPPYLDGTAH